MTVEEYRYLKVRYSNGNERSFAFAPLTEYIDPSMLLSVVHKALDSRRLVLQTAEQLIIVPFDNVESIEVSPSPDKLIPEALHVMHEFT